MCCWISSHFTVGLTVAVWTIIQTSFHIIWALIGYYFYVCKIKSTHYAVIIMYLTYFYNHECGDITLNDKEIFISTKTNKRIIALDSNGTEKEDVYDIIQTILEKAIFPTESSAARRTNIYFQAFIISDAAWIISAFLLFTGTCFHIRKCLSLIFYCPWLIVTACVVLLDVVSAVHFGLDIIQIHSFTTWLKFIGVQNYNDFSNFNSHELSHIIPSIPAISLCLLFSRILVIWILNVVNFFQILNIAVLAFQDNLDGKNTLHQRKPGRRLRGDQSGDPNLMNSSATRIRNWQLFYGASETTSTDSATSSSEKDCNSNKSGRPSKDSIHDQSGALPKSQDSPGRLAPYDRRISSIQDEYTRNRGNVSSYYQGYPDVADDIDNKDDSNGRNSGAVTGSLRNQLPWSYFPASTEVNARRDYSENPSNVPLNSYGRFRPSKKTYASGEITCTEL